MQVQVDDSQLFNANDNDLVAYAVAVPKSSFELKLDQDEVTLISFWSSD